MIATASIGAVVGVVLRRWRRLHDPALAAFLAERPTNDRPALIERALRIGLLALQDAGVTVNVDVVRAEFEKLMRQAIAKLLGGKG